MRLWKGHRVEKGRKQGVFFGSLPNGRRRPRDVIYTGDASVLVNAGPSTFKTASVVCSTLINGLDHSVVTLDPSGEVYSICKPALEAAGFEVKAMCAFSGKVENLIHQEIQDVGCDPYSSIGPHMHPRELISELKKITGWIMPREGDHDSKDRFFTEDAQELGIFLALYLILQDERPTLPGVRRELMRGMHELMQVYAECEEKYPDYMQGIIRELAAGFSGVQGNAGPQAAAAWGTAKRWLSPFSASSELGLHTSGSDWDPRELTDPNKRIALFLVGTLEMMDAYAEPTAMTVNYLLDTIASHNRGGCVTAILDEVGSLALLTLPLALLFYRKCGLRLVLIIQSLMGQCVRKMGGKHAIDEILAGCRYKLISGGSTDLQTLEMFSKLCGTYSARDMTLNNRGPLESRMRSLSEGASHRGFPLLRPEEIQKLGARKWLVVGGDTSPMVLDKVCYWERPEWLAKAGPSPYYRG